MQHQKHAIHKENDIIRTGIKSEKKKTYSNFMNMVKVTLVCVKDQDRKH